MAAPSVRLASRAGAKALFVDHVSPQTRLLEKRRQVFEVEEALEAQKEEFARREEAFKRREEGLRKKDLELTEAFIRFNQVVTENEAKKSRAEKKATEEAGTTVKKEAEIDETAMQIRELREEVAGLYGQRTKLEGYHTFLDAFQRAFPEEFVEVNSVLERYKTLVTSREDLIREKVRLADEIEEQKKLLAKIEKAASTQVLTSENVVSKMKARLDQLRTTVQALQQGAEEATDTKRDEVLELGQVLQCVQNLHVRCTQSSGGVVIKHTPADGEVLGFSHFEGALADPEEQASVLAAALQHLQLQEEADGSPGGAGAPAPQAPMKALTAKELAGMDSNVLRKRLREAISFLHVVGSYIQDFEAIVEDYPGWQTEQKRTKGEREAALAAEANRLAAARAARTGAGKGGSASPLVGSGGMPSRAGQPKLGASSSKASGDRPKKECGLSTSFSMDNSALSSTHQLATPLTATVDGVGGAINVRGAKVYVVKGAKLDAETMARITSGAATPGGRAGTGQMGSSGPSIRRSAFASALGGSTSTTRSRMPAASPMKSTIHNSSFGKP